MSADALAKGADGIGKTREKGKRKVEGLPWSWLVAQPVGSRIWERFCSPLRLPEFSFVSTYLGQ